MQCSLGKYRTVLHCTEYKCETVQCTLLRKQKKTKNVTYVTEGEKKITGKINRDTWRNRDRDPAKTEVHSKENKVEKDCEKRKTRYSKKDI